MTRFTWLRQLGAVAVAAALMGGGAVASQGAGTALGQIHLSKAVMAGGQRLPAGTYTVRLTGERGRPVVGQTLEESQWVEFLQGKEVKARELATVLAPAEAKKVVKSGKPASGAELLRGGDYIRVWISKAGTQYLVHLAIAS